MGPATVYPLRVGVKLSPQAVSIEDQRAVWRIADEAGFDHLWGFDHFAAIGGPTYSPRSIVIGLSSPSWRRP